MSNRGRQNVASYLAHDLGVDWRQGAEWFETCLLDYDVCSNWGNWVSAAGLAPGRSARFHVVKQVKFASRDGVSELTDMTAEQGQDKTVTNLLTKR